MLVGMKNITTTLEIKLAVFKNSNIHLLHVRARYLLSKLKAFVTKTYIQMFPVALVNKAKN